MMKKTLTLLLFALLLTLFLSACQGEPAAEAVQWDPAWAERFDLDEAAQAEFAYLLEPVDVRAECDGFTLHVGQTLGSQTHLYLPLTVTFPADKPLSDLLPEGSEADTLNLDGLDLSRVTTQESPYPTSLRHTSQTHTELSAVPNYENNSICFYLSFASQDFPFPRQDLTLSFQGISMTIPEEGAETEGELPSTALAQGDFSISWNTGDHDNTISKEILDDAGGSLGSFQLSPLGLTADLTLPQGVTLPEGPLGPTLTMTLYDQDGQTIQTSPSSGGGGGSSHYDRTWTFRTLVDPAQVSKVEIGPYAVTLP